jgi:formylglycine-generating enzyme required for sulfatase activity
VTAAAVVRATVAAVVLASTPAGSASTATADPDAPQGYVAPEPGIMVGVPEGLYPMGASTLDSEASEQWVKGNRVHVNGFAIDVNLVTNRDFMAYAAATGAEPPYFSRVGELSRPLQPVVGITYRNASSYCHWLGKRLPTEWEWEVAARAGDDRRYPWGDEAPLAGGVARANIGSERPTSMVIDEYRRDGFIYPSPVGAFPLGRNPWGLQDMAGNVWEWTSTRFEYGIYRRFVNGEDPPPSADAPYLTLRGGSWTNASWSVRSTVRRPMGEGIQSIDVGFRCAKDSAAPPGRIP